MSQHSPEQQGGHYDNQVAVHLPGTYKHITGKNQPHNISVPLVYSNILYYILCVDISAGLLVECGKKWKIVRKILPNSAGNSAEKSEIVRENAK